MSEFGWRERIKIYWRMADLGSLTRRYIVIGAFDGALTIVAIVLAALASVLLASSLIDPETIIISGLGAAVGLAISSGWGAYEAERVERRLELDELEHVMHRSMEKSLQVQAIRFATLWGGLVHAMAPLPAALIPLIPIVIFPAEFVIAAISSVVITLIFLMCLGVWMGRTAKINPLTTGLRMVLAGLITAAICAVIGAVH
ncbi:MAG: VIT1/CCC1 transporter family protein [Promethearchaeota archaeon]